MLSKKPAYLEDWSVTSYEGPHNDPHERPNGRHGASICIGCLVWPVHADRECLATMCGDTEEQSKERAELAAAAPAMVRALLEVEWEGIVETMAYFEGYDEWCPTCARHWRLPESGMAEAPGRVHLAGCPIDAALTLSGFVDQASRDAARERMRGPR